MELNPIDEKKVDGRDLPRLVFVRVQDAIGLLWERNPKLHDIGALITSLNRYGVQELPKYDATLGAIKAGNGRIEALYRMMEDGSYEPPRGCAVDDNGHWVIPILIGTDAESDEMAIAYAIDSNNLTMAGGDYTPVDMLRLWNDKYAGVLRELADNDVFSVTVDPDDVDMLMAVLGEGFSPFDDLVASEDYDESSTISFVVSVTFANAERRDECVNLLVDNGYSPDVQTVRG